MKTCTTFALIGVIAVLPLSPGWAGTSSISNNDSVLPHRARVVKKTPPPAAATSVEDEKLSEDQLAAAMRVNRGDAQCEFNQTVSVRPHAQRAGVFQVSFKNMTYNMVPEPTTTGAVRLEDRRAGVVWLQIPSKSMLMNSRIGQRMVDACTHAEQRAELSDRAAASSQPVAGIGIAPIAAPPIVAKAVATPVR
jgi:hypothetical protein